MALQLHSPLVSLPGELKNEIFALALSTCTPITNPHYHSDPSLSTSTRPTIKHRHIPPLGAALSQTCRSIHSELDIRTLYTSNTFVFTRVEHIHAFHNHLSREQLRWSRKVVIDLREAAFSHASDGDEEEAKLVGNEWLHYLSCSAHAHAPGLWCEKLATLKSDLPDVEDLVLDLTAWQSPFAGTRRGGWKYLQRLLGNTKGLKRLAIKGKCLDSRFWNPTPKPWGLAPWFSPAFCDDSTSLLDLLGAGIREAGVGERKVFAWELQDGVTTLEVKILNVSRRSVALDADLPEKMAQNGLAAWEAFVVFKNQQRGDQSTKASSSTTADSAVTDIR